MTDFYAVVERIEGSEVVARLASMDCRNHGSIHIHNEIEDADHNGFEAVYVIRKAEDIDAYFERTLDESINYAVSVADIRRWSVMAIDPRLDSLRRKVMKAVGVAGIDLPVANDNGQRQIVVALEEEPFSSLVQRLERAGGYANVFVLTGRGVVNVSVMKQECSRLLDGCDHIDMPIGSNSEVGMLLDYLEGHPEGVATDVRELVNILV